MKKIIKGYKRIRNVSLSEREKTLLESFKNQTKKNASAIIRDAIIQEAERISKGESNPNEKKGLKSVRLSFTVSKESEDALKTVCDFYGSSNVSDMLYISIKNYLGYKNEK